MKHSLGVLLPLLLVLVAASAASSYVVGGRRLFKFQSKRDFAGFFLTGAKWDSQAGGFLVDPGHLGEEDSAWVESPNIEPGIPADQIIVSWNAITPPGSNVTVYVQVRNGNLWSRRFTIALWNRDGKRMPRIAPKDQKDNQAELDWDTLIMKKPADAFRLSVKLSSADGKTFPVLRLLTAHVLDSAPPPARIRLRRNVYGKDLPVPERSQLTIPRGNVFCSATSTAMVLDYWAQRLGRPELSVPLQTAVDGIYDGAHGGTGNWPFNTAYAGEFGGLRAYVTRLASVAQIEQWIEKDIPVIVSVDYNVLMHRNTKERMGHLMVLRGFAENGDPIINDPYTKLDRGEAVRRVFKREYFRDSWLNERGARGAVYLIYPDGWSIPKNKYADW